MSSEDIDDLLQKSTLPDDLRLSVTGNFPSETEAQALLNTVFAFAKIIGASFDLTALDAVTIADDYVGALAAVDRGYPGMKAVEPTRDEFGAGFAMAVPVLRDGEHKSHVVLDAALVRPLVDPQHEFYGMAVHTLSHELAHVYDHMLRVKAMPNYYGSTLTDLREAVLSSFAMAAWDEYVASRLSAPWGTDDYSARYEESLMKMLETLLARSEAAKRAFSEHKNVDRTMAELRGVFETFFVRTSYLVGHVDGLDRALEDEAPTFATALKQTTWLKDIWMRYRYCLREMFDKLETRKGVEDYDALKEIGEELLMAGGMGFVKLPNGSYFVGFNRTQRL